MIQTAAKGLSPFITALVLSAACYADIPSGYYDDASGKSGEALKSALHVIVSDHTKYPYTSSSTDVWDLLKITDEDPENSDSVVEQAGSHHYSTIQKSHQKVTFCFVAGAGLHFPFARLRVVLYSNKNNQFLFPWSNKQVLITTPQNKKATRR